MRRHHPEATHLIVGALTGFAAATVTVLAVLATTEPDSPAVRHPSATATVTETTTATYTRMCEGDAR